jgi:hypothetical protein
MDFTIDNPVANPECLTVGMSSLKFRESTHISHNAIHKPSRMLRGKPFLRGYAVWRREEIPELARSSPTLGLIAILPVDIDALIKAIRLHNCLNTLWLGIITWNSEAFQGNTRMKACGASFKFRKVAWWLRP